MGRKKELLAKIVKAHQFMVTGDAAYREKLEKALQPVVDELVSIGVKKEFVEGVLYFGKEFVDSLRGSCMATVSDLENIFGSNVENLTDIQEREYKLASKHNGLMWKSKNDAGDKVSIDVLAYN